MHPAFPTHSRELFAVNFANPPKWSTKLWVLRGTSFFSSTTSWSTGLTRKLRRNHHRLSSNSLIKTKWYVTMESFSSIYVSALFFVAIQCSIKDVKKISVLCDYNCFSHLFLILLFTESFCNYGHNTAWGLCFNSLYTTYDIHTQKHTLTHFILLTSICITGQKFGGMFLHKIIEIFWYFTFLISHTCDENLKELLSYSLIITDENAEILN